MDKSETRLSTQKIDETTRNVLRGRTRKASDPTPFRSKYGQETYWIATVVMRYCSLWKPSSYVLILTQAFILRWTQPNESPFLLRIQPTAYQSIECSSCYFGKAILEVKGTLGKNWRRVDYQKRWVYLLGPLGIQALKWRSPIVNCTFCLIVPLWTLKVPFQPWPCTSINWCRVVLRNGKNPPSRSSINSK